jgi:hypothetical protein
LGNSLDTRILTDDKRFLGNSVIFTQAGRLALGGGAHIMFHEVSMARENASREFRRSVKSMGETRDRSIRRTEFRASL